MGSESCMSYWVSISLAFTIDDDMWGPKFSWTIVSIGRIERNRSKEYHSRNKETWRDDKKIDMHNTKKKPKFS